MSYDSEKAACFELLAPGPTGSRSPWQDLARCSTSKARACLPFAIALQIPALPLGLHQSGQRAGEEQECLSVALSSVASSSVASNGVASNGSFDPRAIKELCFITGREIVPEYAATDVLRRAVQLAYSKDRITEETIPQLLSSILRRAIYLEASDIHFEKISHSTTRLRFRVSGVLHSDQKIALTTDEMQQLIRRIKVLAELDTTVTNRAQDGAFTFRDDSWNIRLRVSVIPQVFGEKAVLRLLHNFFLERQEDSVAEPAASAFDALGVTRTQQNGLFRYLHSDRGVILLSGPTGSGKSTLLYTSLQYLNHESKNIVTIEDPIERIIPGVCQTEIDSRHRSFADTLRSLLRQDPDIVLLGEIRDAETAEVAMSAGLIGTLVLTTVHAGSCFEVVQRLVQLGVSYDVLASAIRLLSSQRLLTRNCAACLELHPPDPFVAHLFQLSEGQQLGRSPGCEHCREVGSGRIAVFEFLPMSEEVCAVLRRAGKNEEWVEQLARAARQAGYRSLAFSVRELLVNRVISSEMAMQTLGVLLA